jgi:putative Mg2+ transporter-C (MgtC) family protein
VQGLFDGLVEPREWSIAVEVFVAMLLGGIVGFERSTASKPAGMRTHMLVSGSAALLVGLSFALLDRAVALGWSDLTAADPIRVLQAIVIGISFLGAGTIFRGDQPQDIHGLTTAASLLMSAGIGVAVGLRHFVLALLLTVLVTTVLRVFASLENRMEEAGERK